MGALLIRQVVVGRSSETPGDLRDLAISFFSADVDGMSEVLTRRGSSDTGSGEVAAAPGVTPTNNALAQKVIELGQAAKGYRWGATGPEYYDCSGLIWKACRELGIYKGSRFTSHNFSRIAGNIWTQVAAPAAGDIVLWTGKHMGVSLGGDTMYSARSRSKGIGESTVSGDNSYFGFDASYWRLISGPRESE